MSPFCTYCGKEIKASWKVCSYCGKPVKISSLKIQPDSKPQQASQDSGSTEIETSIFSEIESLYLSYLNKSELGLKYLKNNGLSLYLQIPTPKELLESLESGYQKGEVNQEEYDKLKKIYLKLIAEQKDEPKRKIVKIPPGFEPDTALTRPLTFKTQDNDEIQISIEFMDHLELITDYDLKRLVRNCSIILTNFNGTLEQDNYGLHLERLQEHFRLYPSEKMILGFIDLTIALMILNSLLPSKGNFSTKEFYYLACVLNAYFKLIPV